MGQDARGARTRGELLDAGTPMARDGPNPAAGPVQPDGAGSDAEPLGGLQRDPLHGHGGRKAGKSSPRRSSATRVTGTPSSPPPPLSPPRAPPQRSGARAGKSTGPRPATWCRPAGLPLFTHGGQIAGPEPPGARNDYPGLQCRSPERPDAPAHISRYRALSDTQRELQSVMGDNRRIGAGRRTVRHGMTSVGATERRGPQFPGCAGFALGRGGPITLSW